MKYNVKLTTELDWREATAWQMPDTPFMQFAFWDALQSSGAIGNGSGWLPVYILVYNDKKLVAVMPVFIKHHHQGEYVFDFAWAEAYECYGQDYYPRLVTSVPFTPVTGERIWLAEDGRITGSLWQALKQAIDSIATSVKASTWHGLFVNDILVQQAQHCLIRINCQFMWLNRNAAGEQFTDFNEFLTILTAKKRKSIKVERQKVAAQGLQCQIKLGDTLTDDDWQICYQCYAMTYLIRGRQPYLSLDFFIKIAKTLPQHLMMAQAVDRTGSIVACSLFFYDDTTLYGRYWGSLADYDSLHFELCYYQGIEFAIAKKLAKFDPGAQGEHKLIRGFMPILTYSLHWVYDRRFLPAIANFCKVEQDSIQAYYEEALASVPFNHDYQKTLPKFQSLNKH